MKRFLTTLLLLLVSCVSLNAATVRSTNFIVTADTQEIAEKAAQKAEMKRVELARYWFGREFPRWAEQCPVRVIIDPSKGASGVTSFAFNNGQVYGWEMQVQGPEPQVMDSVIPHEVNHTIFASYFGRPLPRWADEGAAGTTEDTDQRELLNNYLHQIKGTQFYIPVRSLVRMTEYPQNQRYIGSLYSEGHSLTTYLLHRKNPETFIKLLCDFQTNGWEPAFRDNYGFDSIEDLEASWLEWVANGVPVADSPVKDERPTLVAFVSTNCGPCKKFKADNAAGHFKQYRVYIVYVDNGLQWCDLNYNEQIDPGEVEQGKRLYSDFVRKTGVQVSSVPLFWIPGTVEYILGYSEAIKLLSWARDTLKKLIGIIFRGEPAVVITQPQPVDPSTITPIPKVPDSATEEPSPFTLQPKEKEPEKEPEPTAEAESEEIDWSAVNLVVLVSKDSSKIGLVNLIKGPLTRKIREMIDSKVTVTVITETAEPTAYNAVVSETNVTPEPVYVLVLVDKQNIGLKGLIASRVEKSLLSKHDRELTDARIEIIFKRTDSKTYDAVTTAIEQKEPEKVYEWKTWILALLSSLAGSTIPLLFKPVRSAVWGMFKKKPDTEGLELSTNG